MNPEAQLKRFMAQYTPQIRGIAQSALRKMRKQLPGAVEIVYDNYNALVIAFGPTESPSEALGSIALYPRWVTLFFLKGAKLRDPKKILKGAGKVVRRIDLESAEDLDQLDVRALITQAAKTGKPLRGPRRWSSSRFRRSSGLAGQSSWSVRAQEDDVVSSRCHSFCASAGKSPIFSLTSEMS